MLSSEMSEGKCGLIEINDSTPRVVELMLIFVYKGDIELQEAGDLLELLMLADKYQMVALAIPCLQHMLHQLNTENIATIVRIARNFADVQDFEETWLSICDKLRSSHALC